MTPRERAIYLLRVVSRFVDEQPLIGELTIIFDDAECDGECLANDCEAAAEELEREGTK